MMHTFSLRTAATYCLAVAVALLPWHAVWILREVIIAGEKWQYGTIGIFLGDGILAFALVSVYVTHRPIWHMGDTRRRTFYLSACLFIVWCFLGALLWSPDPSLSLAVTARIALAGMLAYAIVLTKRTHLIVWAFIIGATLHACMGIWHYTTQTPLPASPFLGTAHHDIIWGGTATTTTDSGRWMRAYGAMPHPNILGGYAAVALCLLPLLIPSASPRIRGILIGMGNILFFAVLCTGSRSALYALVIGGFYLVIRFFPQLPRATRLYIGTTALITVLLFVCAYHDTFVTRTLHGTTVATNAITDRTAYLHHAATLWTHHPWHGVGIGAYTLAVHNTILPGAPIWQAQPVHNIFSLLMAEIGIIGGVLLLWICWLLRVRCIVTLRTPQSAAPTAALIALVCMGCADHWPLTAHVGVTTIALCLGIFLASSRTTQDAPH